MNQNSNMRNMSRALLDFEPHFRLYLLSVGAIKPVRAELYLRDVRDFIGWVMTYSSCDSITRITSRIVLDYFSYLKSADISSSVLKRKQNACRALFDFMIRQGWIEVNPVSKHVSPQGNPRQYKAPKKIDDSYIIDTFISELSESGHSESEIANHKKNVREFMSLTRRSSKN